MYRNASETGAKMWVRVKQLIRYQILLLIFLINCLLEIKYIRSNQVASCEDVVGVNCLLQSLQEINACLSNTSREELLS